ncbi:tRNA pseudouridine(38-40) synthase TruA [Lutibacter sp. B2]|nr:tRNA pseudouridine(38-40) synthase TruA [Lutibacter sp. B2]
MKNIKLTIEYDGTDFLGWQKQSKGRTVQEEIEKALSKILKKDVKINGSGRTDASVHAKGQVANFREAFTIPVERLPVALNSVLPDDIAILSAIEMNYDFHARYNAMGKKYVYKIYNSNIRSPLSRNYVYYVPQDLDIEKMKMATKYFLGTHDFKGFMASGSSVKETVRTIYNLDITEKEKQITVEVSGNGFLYNMVRIITGTLVDVGRGKINLNDLENIIASGDRNRSGHTASAQGLYLYEVYYK